MFKRILGVVCVCVAVVGGTVPAIGQAACDRACLRGILDQYLNAVVKHDPTAAPLVVGFRQTENAINVRPGNGMWKSVTGLGKVQRRYFDAVSMQAAYFGTVEEGDSTAIVNVRVRVENRKVTEAEWHVARENDPGLSGPRQPGRGPANAFNKDYLAQNPPPERTVPANARTDRATLMRIVESYFDAITSHDGSVALTHPGCGRVENGSPAPAGRFLPPANAAQPPAGGQRGGAPARSAEGTIASAACRISAGRWPPPGGCRWSTKKPRWYWHMPSLSGGPEWRRRGMSSPSGSSSTKRRSGSSTRPCSIHRPISPFPIGRPTTATGPCREVSCPRQRRRNKGDL